MRKGRIRKALRSLVTPAEIRPRSREEITRAVRRAETEARRRAGV